MKRVFALFRFASACLLACAAGNAAEPSVPAPAPGGVTLTVEAENSILPAGNAQEAMVRIAISAPALARQPRLVKTVNLAVAFDCSGSMSGGKIVHARQAAQNALEQLGENDFFSLVIYNHSAQVLIPATRVTESAKRELAAVIGSIPAGGGTALFSGVSLAADELRKAGNDPRGVRRLILLSDGQANVGPSSPAELGKLGSALVKEGITVSTVGIGSDYNEDLMTSLAQNSDGNFYFVARSSDLVPILARELGSALSVAARRVKVRIDCPPGVRPRGILGCRCRIDGQSIELDFNQIYAGHDKVLILQLDLPPQPDGSSKPLADVTLEYLTAEAEKAPVLTRSVAVNFSADSSASARSLNKAVSADVALQQSAAIREEAINQSDCGNILFASEKLRQAQLLLERNAALTGSEEVRETAKRLADESDRLAQAETAPATYNETRKEIKGRSYQIRNSQPVRQ